MQARTGSRRGKAPPRPPALFRRRARACRATGRQKRGSACMPRGRGSTPLLTLLTACVGGEAPPLPLWEYAPPAAPDGRRGRAYSHSSAPARPGCPAGESPRARAPESRRGCTRAAAVKVRPTGCPGSWRRRQGQRTPCGRGTKHFPPLLKANAGCARESAWPVALESRRAPHRGTQGAKWCTP